MDYNIQTMKNLLFSLVLIIVISITACPSDNKDSGQSPLKRGEYSGQTPPGDSSRPFAFLGMRNLILNTGHGLAAYTPQYMPGKTKYSNYE
jgi:hypothetical protein